MKAVIHWLAWKPTPYNDFFFRALAADPQIDLTVYFRRAASSAHPWSTPLATGYRRQVYRDGQWPFLADPAVMSSIESTPGFIVTAGWPGFTAKAVLLRAARRGSPFLVWTDTPKLRITEGRRGRAKVVECVEIGRPYPAWHRAFRRWMYRTVFSRARKVMGTGQPGVDALAALGCPPEKLVNLPFFVPLPESLSRRADDAESASRSLTFAACGQLIRRKGFDIALEAFGAILPQAPRPFRFVILGDGPERASLQRQAKAAGLSANVDFAGWKEPDQIARLFGQADALVHPVRSDAYPVVVLEAMAAGLPVLGSDAAGSVVDRVKHGQSGFIHPAGDARALGFHCLEMLRHPERIPGMRRAARATAGQWPVSRGVEIVKAALRLCDQRLPSGTQGRRP